MLAKDLRGKSIKELQKTLVEALENYEKHTQDVYKGKEKNTAKTKSLKKDIARIKTVMSEKKFMKEVKNV